MRSVLVICLMSLAGLQIAAAEEAVDPPSRVARLSYTDGDVSLAPAGTEEWAEAVLNRPLTTGDRMWVDNGARAELQVGSATLHLDQGTGFSFVALDDDLLHMSLTEGAATIRVQRKLESERIEIETPNATVALLHPGEYHIEANAAGDRTVVRTRSGESEVFGDQKSFTVRANEEGVFTGTSELAANIDRLGPRTAFEDWANERDRRNENPVSSRYVSREVIGYEDLDHHGDWYSEPGYGYVWRPTYVVAGWAPYRYGRWVWVSPWGWNWVDDARWGFAPFHYGRWAYLRSRWCWVPGPRHIRPIYAPALVAWGGSPGFGVSVSFGSGIGWFPLGPREIYVPGYRYSRRYLHDVNVSNTIIVNNTHITNIYNGRGRDFDYRYGRDPHAVTVVDRDRFRGGRPIDGRWTHPSERDLRRWHHDARPPAIAPDRDSVFASRVLGRIPGRAQHVSNQVAVSRGDANTNSNGRSMTGRAGLTRVPFDVERRAIEANGGRPVGRRELIAANPRPDGNAVRGNDNGRTNQFVREANPSRRDQVRNDARDVVRSTNESARQWREQNPGNVRPAETARTLNDRPSWAQRQRDDSARSTVRTAPAVNSLREQSRNERNDIGRFGQRENGESARQWRGGSAPQSVQRSTERPDSSARQDRNTDSNELRDHGNARPREQSPSRAWQQPAQPQYRAPPEERRVEQPRQQQFRQEQFRQEQPRQEQPRREQSRPEQPRFDRGHSVERSGGRQDNGGRAERSQGGRPGPSERRQ